LKYISNYEKNNGSPVDPPDLFFGGLPDPEKPNPG